MTECFNWLERERNREGNGRLQPSYLHTIIEASRLDLEAVDKDKIGSLIMARLCVQLTKHSPTSISASFASSACADVDVWSAALQDDTRRLHSRATSTACNRGRWGVNR